MYAELTGLKFKPEYMAEVPKMTEQFVALHKTLKSFVSQTYLVNEESGEGLALSLWETKEDLDAAVAVCIPCLLNSRNQSII